jgi:hypothetical protein
MSAQVTSPVEEVKQQAISTEDTPMTDVSSEKPQVQVRNLEYLSHSF